MRITLTACLAAVTLALAACGGSDDPSGDDGSEGSSAGGDQARVVDLLLGAAEGSGIELDETCVNETLGELSDEDAKAIADAGVEGNPEVSDAGNEIGDRVYNDCIDAESYLTSQANVLADNEESIDADCIIDELTGLTVNEIDELLFDTAFACSSDV